MSQVVLLSPHNDDETLFAGFQILRCQPHVVVCTRAVVQYERGYTFMRDGQEIPINSVVREQETAEALAVLGAEYWEQWEIPDTFDIHDHKNISALEERIDHLATNYYFCIAPMHEADGNVQHNIISMLAEKAFGPSRDGDRLTKYSTYTRSGRSQIGNRVEIEPHWPGVKMRALACYESQLQHPSTQDHFMRGLWEWTI